MEGKPYSRQWQTENSKQDCPALGALNISPSAQAFVATVEFVHEKRDDFNAWSTIAIGLFTALLFFVTYSQVRLLREEFISTHRPKIVVRGFNVLDHTALAGDEETVEFLYVNIGATKAHIFEIGIATELSQPSGGLTFVNTKIDGVTLTSGDKEIFSVQSRVFFNAKIHASVAKPGKAMKAYAVGYVRYRDDRGRVRETGFCRETDFHTRSWRKTPESEYEYED